MFKCRTKILSKFVEKLLKYRIMVKDIIMFLGLDYRDASLVTLYLLSFESVFQKTDQSDKIYCKNKHV